MKDANMLCDGQFDFSILTFSRDDVDRLVQWDTRATQKTATSKWTRTDRVQSAHEFVRSALAVFCMLEAMHRSRATTLEGAVALFPQVFARATFTSGFRPDEIVKLVISCVGKLRKHGQADAGEAQSLPTRELAYTTLQAILEGFDDLDGLVSDAKSVGLAAEGSELSDWVDRLHAISRLLSPHLATRVRALGEDYQCGKIGVDDVARILRIGPADAVYELERGGFARPLTVLTEDDRLARLQRIEASRGRVATSDVMARVVSSQRLEGVDVFGASQD